MNSFITIHRIFLVYERLFAIVACCQARRIYHIRKILQIIIWSYALSIIRIYEAIFLLKLSYWVESKMEIFSGQLLFLLHNERTNDLDLWSQNLFINRKIFIFSYYSPFLNYTYFVSIAFEGDYLSFSLSYRGEFWVQDLIYS